MIYHSIGRRGRPGREFSFLRSHAKELLKERYRQGHGEQSFPEWLQMESENDPNFFRWLFEDESNLADWQIRDMHSAKWNKFLEEIWNE